MILLVGSMRYLGVDYGKRRIGLAVTEAGGCISRPFLVIANKGLGANIAFLRELVEKEGIGCVVIGLPLRFDEDKGIYKETQMSYETKVFGEALAGSIHVTVAYHNEAYSSFEAEDYIKNTLGIKKPQKIREMVDKVAASMILQEYLDLVHK